MLALYLTGTRLHLRTCIKSKFLLILILHIKKITILIPLLNITEATLIEESKYRIFEDNTEVEEERERKRNLTTAVLNYFFFKCKSTVTKKRSNMTKPHTLPLLLVLRQPYIVN